MIPRDQIDKVVNSANIVDFISERVPDLRRMGANYKSRCPFHEEKTASFVVSEAKQIFKCFGCGIAGDVIKFVMTYENLTYPDSIRMVASKVGVEITEDRSDWIKKESDDETDELKDLYIRTLNDAGDYFHNNLLNIIESDSKNPVSKFVKDRELTTEILKLYKIGYALEGWQSIRSEKKFSKTDEKLLIDSGLLKKNEKGNVYDFFRNRIVFPVFDIMGNIIAFSARVLDNEDIPKYLNSPESIIYKKNSVLYGFFQSKETIRKTRSAILVEGNIDQISLHKFGIKNSVALCGTGFTEEHSKLLKRNCDRITVMFDGDKAGTKSALKSADMLLSKGINTNLVYIPNDGDPDSYINENGPEKTMELINDSLNIIDFKLTITKKLESIEDKTDFIRGISETIYKIDDRLVKSIYINELSKKLDINEKTISDELKRNHTRQLKLSQRKSFTDQENIKPEREKFIPLNEHEVEFNIAYLMISNTELRKKYIDEITEEYFTNPEVRKLFYLLYEAYENGEDLNFNQIQLRSDNESFKEFLYDYVSTQDNNFQGAKNIDDDQINRIYNTAFEQNLKKIKHLKFIRDKENLKEEMINQTNDNEAQLELLMEIYNRKKNNS